DQKQTGRDGKNKCVSSNHSAMERPNAKHQPPEPAGAERRVDSDLNGWLRSAACYGSAFLSRAGAATSPSAARRFSTKAAAEARSWSELVRSAVSNCLASGVIVFK